MAYNWTILVVDDEIDNLNVLVTYLELQGLKVYTALTGNHALELLNDVRPGCILLDMALPGLSGWDVLTRIRMNAEISDVPVLALTAHVMHASKADVLSYGFDGYITKPFDLSKVMKEIRYWLERDPKI